jgi:hypothetical protein
MSCLHFYIWVDLLSAGMGQYPICCTIVMIIFSMPGTWGSVDMQRCHFSSMAPTRS